MSIRAGERDALPFFINATDLSAGTTQYLVSPHDGYIAELQVVVQTAIVTGGAITASNKTGAVAGLSCAVANSATVGTVVTDTPNKQAANRYVAKGEIIAINVDAAFNGGGALNGNLILSVSADPDNVMPF